LLCFQIKFKDGILRVKGKMDKPEWKFLIDNTIKFGTVLDTENMMRKLINMQPNCFLYDMAAFLIEQPLVALDENPVMYEEKILNVVGTLQRLHRFSENTAPTSFVARVFKIIGFTLHQRTGQNI
jgi:hypothetical protein